MDNKYNIDMTNLIQEYDTAKTNREGYTLDFPQLDNLVNATPLNSNPKAPVVGDTTVAGLVRAIPRASLQQIPVFSATINGSKQSIKAHVGSWILRDRIFNEDTFGKGILSTMQIGAEKALSHGYAPFMATAGTTIYNEFGTSMKLLHYTDVNPEPGISDASESAFFFVSAHPTKSKIKKIIKAAEQNPNTSWDVDGLKELLNGVSDGKDYSQYQANAEITNTSAAKGTVEIVTKYETGRGGRFISFCPDYEEKVLRVIENNSKFGYPRVLFLVIDPAPLTPFGLSRVRLASPNQNFNNTYYQNIASMLLINSDPPIFKRGRFNRPVQLKRGATWETTDLQATAELKSMDNGSLSQFKPITEHIAGQIRNIMGNSIDSINSGNNFSKTGPGVRQSQQVMDMSTNQVTNILENFLRQYALTALDMEVADRAANSIEGVQEEIIVDDEAKDAINRVAAQDFVPTPEQPEPVPVIGDDNKLAINWADFYDSVESWSVNIELSIGKDELEEKKRGDLQDTLTVLAQNADVLGPTAQQRVEELTDMLLEKSVPESKRSHGSAMPQMPPMPNPHMPVPSQLPPQVN